MTKPDVELAVPADVLFRTVGDDAVLLNLATGQYYGLDPVGARMWDRLVAHGRVEPAVADLLAEFDVEEEQLRADLNVLVERLASAGLLDDGRSA